MLWVYLKQFMNTQFQELTLLPKVLVKKAVLYVISPIYFVIHLFLQRNLTKGEF